MVRPHLEYGNVVWGPNYQGDIKMLEKFLRRGDKNGYCNKRSTLCKKTYGAETPVISLPAPTRRYDHNVQDNEQIGEDK